MCLMCFILHIVRRTTLTGDDVKRLFLTDYIGLCNRLDCLCLSFAIHKAHGHQICLDWPETDALRVDGTVTKKFGLLDRIGAIKLRGDSTDLFPALGQYRRIVQRTCFGPPELTDSHFVSVAQSIRLRADLWEHIRRVFLTKRTVVGVHIRRGDFQLVNEGVYDVHACKHAAVPTWWYEYAMSRINASFPDTKFLLSCTGDSSVFNTLKKNFDVFELNCPSPYSYKGKDHQSTNHPVADLFALACCSVVIGTPGSTFTHFAANALGPSSVCLLPPLRTSRVRPIITRMEFPVRRAIEWSRAWLRGLSLELGENNSNMPMPDAPALDWVKTWN